MSEDESKKKPFLPLRYPELTRRQLIQRVAIFGTSALTMQLSELVNARPQYNIGYWRIYGYPMQKIYQTFATVLVNTPFPVNQFRFVQTFATVCVSTPIPASQFRMAQTFATVCVNTPMPANQFRAVQSFATACVNTPFQPVRMAQCFSQILVQV